MHVCMYVCIEREREREREREGKFLTFTSGNSTSSRCAGCPVSHLAKKKSGKSVP
jgi:hypothetical protein